MPTDGLYTYEYKKECPKGCTELAWFYKLDNIGPRVYAVYRCYHHKPSYAFRVRVLTKAEQRKLCSKLKCTYSGVTLLVRCGDCIKKLKTK